MKVISLDEQGDFEKMGREGSNPVFIAGIIYDDQDYEEEISQEKKRIVEYLKGICKDCNVQYPQSLHSNGSNNKDVGKVKTALTETIADFLQKGTIADKYIETKMELSKIPERKGVYSIFCLVCCNNQAVKQRELPGMFTEHNHASNLYVHMAEEIVERLLFHNPIEDMIDVQLELPTRRVVLSGKNKEENASVQEYKDRGFREEKTRDNDEAGEKHEFVVANHYIYRTAIEREQLRTQNTQLQIKKFGVKSINYIYQDNSNSRRMSFLYLADIVCSLLGWELPACEKKAISLMKEKMDSYTGHQDNYLFAFDDNDDSFKRAWTCYENGDYYGTLSEMHKGTKITGSTRLYVDFWYPRLMDKMKENLDLSYFEVALKKYHDSALNNNVDQEKLLYIFEKLQELSKCVKKDNREGHEIIYDFYDTAMTTYCHIGDSKTAKKYFDKCVEYATHVGIDKYLRTRHKMAVLLCDLCNFDDAIQVAEETLQFYEELSKVKKNILKDRYAEDKTLAIAHSQLAQAYAFSLNEQAEEHFKEALSLYKNKENPDYLITCSYLLHYYIEMDKREKYLALAQEYFGGNADLEKQFTYMVREGSKAKNPRFALKYALYVYVKGLYKFSMDNISEELAEKLADIVLSMKDIDEQSERFVNGHPWEMIYKHLGVICWKLNKKEQAMEYFKKVARALKVKGPAIEAIIQNAYREIFMETGMAKIDGCEYDAEKVSKAELTYMYH